MSGGGDEAATTSERKSCEISLLPQFVGEDFPASADGLDCALLNGLNSTPLSLLARANIHQFLIGRIETEQHAASFILSLALCTRTRAAYRSNFRCRAPTSLGIPTSPTIS